MVKEKLSTVTIEGATLIFRNFAGKEGMYNRAGDRNFSVILPEDVAAVMEADGWNIKILRAQEEGDTPTPYLSVAVNFSNRPPRIVTMTSRGRQNLSEENVEILDWADIATADLIVSPYEWVNGNKTGIKAYLKSLFVQIEEDELERKWGVNDVDTVGGGDD